MRRSSFFVILGALGFISCDGSSQPLAPTTQTTSFVISGVTTLSETKPSVQLKLTSNSQDVTNAATWQSSNPAIATVASGLVMAVGPGNVMISATYQGKTPSVPLSVAQDTDCLAYDPSSLVVSEISNTPPPFWIVGVPTAGGISSLAAADSLVDANNNLALLQRYRQICFVGRSNGRPHRAQYVVEYFLSYSGQQTTIAPEDCVSYSAGALQVVSQGPNGWAVMTGGTQLALLDTQLEANLVVAAAAPYSNECYIGRGNTRADAYDFITDYWR